MMTIKFDQRNVINQGIPILMEIIFVAGGVPCETLAGSATKTGCFTPYIQKNAKVLPLVIKT